MAEKAPFERILTVPAFSFRWMNSACYQFKLPNGKTFVVDPFFPQEDDPHPMWREKSSEIVPEDLGSADYIFINHTHADHVGSLKETYDLYKSRILCHAANAFVLCRDLDLPQTKVFPFEHERTYHFPEFDISTYTARHVGRPDAPGFDGEKDIGTKYEILNAYGSLFNSNFVLDTKTNLRIGFCAGVFDDHERYVWKNEGVNVFIRQMSWEIRRNMIEELAEDFMSTGAQIMLPLHHEEDYKNEDKNGWAIRFNEYLASKGYSGRVFMPERAKWHSITMGVTLED